ncbi:hypothetical protein INT47_010500 [Mucor saturninus]|uniref:Homeobox domain-containing protein n=1 Tax=Mucor saturninus TaxID=64648 RepID=A0A8H7REB8_9FUNG|nr:hypothetical protein INT47_010500 [Mucor saturninus]
MKKFKPIVLYDSSNTSDTISQTDLLYQQTLIEEHRVKTRDMLNHNAKLWESEAPLDHSSEPSLDQKNVLISPASFVNTPVSEAGRAISSHQTRDEFPKTIKLTPGTTNPTEPQLYSHEVFTLEDVSPSSSRRSSNVVGKSEEDEDDYFDGEDECHTNTTTFITEPQFHHTYKPNISRKRRRGNLPKKVTEFLKRWLILHKKHPYPTEREKQKLADETGLMVNQISNWFINARRRILQPLLESENKQFTMTADSSLPNDANVVGGTSTSNREDPVAESDQYQPHYRHNYDDSGNGSSKRNLLLNEPTEDDETIERVPKYNAPPPWVLLPTKLPSMNILEKDLDAFNPKK